MCQENYQIWHAVWFRQTWTNFGKFLQKAYHLSSGYIGADIMHTIYGVSA